MTAIAEPLHIALQTANPADRIALRGIHLRARVAGMSLKATIEQTFVNIEDRAIEALYTFPLPEGAAVCGFEVVFFDKVFTGVVDETDAAIEKYDDAISQGHGAYLLEQHRPDVFSVRVGNLKPRQAVTIRLTYVTDIEIVDRAIRLSFPTTIAPRYVTTSGTDPIDAAIDGDALNPPHVLSVPYGLTMELEIDLGNSLANITSASHTIRVDRPLTPSPGTPGEGWGQGRRGSPKTVTLAATTAEMNRDLILTLELTKEQQPFALAATTPQNENFIAVNFLPEFDEAAGASSPSETVFLLDCSGSMMGESIQQAAAALECCLRAMSTGDTFNICRFGSTFDLLSSEPLIYSPQTFNQALAFVRNHADLGGTEILAPLEAIFAQRPDSKTIRNIVLLTDGQVSNESAVIALARRKRSRNRIFTFGIGAAASSFLVKGLARVTSGAAEFIAPGERIEDKVLRTFGRIASPPVTDVEIDWGNADAQIAPRILPPLFDGDALRVFARLSGKIPPTVTLKCKTATGPKSWTVAVNKGADPASVLPTLWARAMIRTIEEEDGVQQTASISAPSLDRSNLIELSKRYNLLCGLTSFIAVEHRSLEDRNEGKPELRRMPVALAEGWGGSASPAGAGMGVGSGLLDLTRESHDTEYGAFCDRISPTPQRQYPLPAASMCPPTPRPAPSKGFLGKLKRALGGSPKPEQERLKAFDNSFRRSGSKPPGPVDLIALLSRQSADGSFDSSIDTDALLNKLGGDPAPVLAEINKFLEDAKVPIAKQEKLRQNLLVLLTFKFVFPDRQPAWNRAFKKAILWITDEASLPAGSALKFINAWEL